MSEATITVSPPQRLQTVRDRLRDDPVTWIIGVLLILLVGREVAAMVAAWNDSPESSHGFLVLPAFLYLVWRKRARVSAEQVRTCSPAAVLAVAALALFVVGKQSGLPSVYRPAAVLLVWSYALWFLGTRAWRLLAGPFLLLLFLVPPPRAFLTEVSIPLRTAATEISCAIARAMGIPLSWTGTTIVLPGGTLEIEAACSGLRGAIALLLLAIFMGELKGARPSGRLLLMGAAILLALVLNIVRVFLTIAGVNAFGLDVATSSFHEVMGLAIIVVGAIVLAGIPVRRRAPTEVPP
jgi:exosortase